jgi:hypothetical protein
MIPPDRSTRRFVRLAAGACLMALAGCASGPTVRTNVEPGTDFAQYKTFAFMSPLGTDRAGYRSIVSQQLVVAAQREMEARGMRRVDDSPQLLVNFGATLSEKLEVTTMPSPAYRYGGPGYYGYRAGLYSTWAYYDQTMVTQYTQGTLNIDIVDAVRKQLVWEGVVTDSVTQKDLDDVTTAINRAVAAAFAKYPIGPAAR